MNWFDTTDNVIAWSSEEVIVPYRDPFTGRARRYFPDFVIRMRRGDGKIQTVMIEVKPDGQTRPPKTQKNRTKRYINEVYTWGINKNKWEQARLYCAKHDWDFQIWTEKNMGFT